MQLHTAPALRAENRDGLSEFDARLASSGIGPLTSAAALDTIQVNIGLTCNLICRHCHVNSSPKRQEQMDWETMEAILELADELEVNTIDITGGAPEMNPYFRRFVAAIRQRKFAVIVRTNLTILLTEGYEDLPEFFRDQQVRLVASLPCYSEENVDAQRGDGVYAESIEALRLLNKLGFGSDPRLSLSLVFNPIGPELPPRQAELEAQYKAELKARHGIAFTDLITITNVPIGRFRGDLQKQKKLAGYLALLEERFNGDTVEPLMCRHQISVAWDGTLHDCDFNLARGWGAEAGGEGCNVKTVRPAQLLRRRVVTGDHCFACTAGAGSSCGGALV